MPRPSVIVDAPIKMLPTLMIIGILAVSATWAYGQFSVLRPFQRGPSEGNTPYAALTASGSTLFGTTSSGGSNNYGTIFSINTDGSGYTTLHSFSGTAADGADPYCALLLIRPVLYGTTQDGGSSGAGTIFRIGTNGAGFLILHSFSGVDGRAPYAGLVASGQVLYGTTLGPGGGTVFRINIDGTGFTNLYSFAGTAWPHGLTLAGSTLYGTTQLGGSAGLGSVFKINSDGTGFSILHNFQGYPNDGYQPLSTLALFSGDLYGMTADGGGINKGTIFKVSTDGSNYAVLHSFAAGIDGYSGWNNSLVLQGSRLYGMTGGGGAYGFGAVFGINTDGSGYSPLHPFAGGPADGAFSWCSLTSVGSTLYGMTTLGGSNSVGTVFRINGDGTGYALMHSFGLGASDGSNPQGALTPAGPNLYGMTYGGGSANLGVMFSIRTNGDAYSVQHSFSGGSSNGAAPLADLVLAGAALYGMPDGVGTGGTIFSIGTNGQGYSNLYIFGASAVWPQGNLLISGATFYGTTSTGGAYNLGAVFSVDTGAAALQILHDFGAGSSDGNIPVGSLTLLGSTLYGTTSAGGSTNSAGVVFRINTDGGGYSTLHVFTGDLHDGNFPIGTLALSGNTLYGTTLAGGSGNGGTVFKISADGTGFAILHHFGSTPNDGTGPGWPGGSAVLSGSILYGTTSSGGSNNLGTVYALNVDGSGYTILHHFVGGVADGSNPQGPMAIAGSAAYGMTKYGGSNNAGVIFKLDLVPPAITQQPVSVITNQDSTVTFAVGVAGTSPLSFQWQLNGANLAGATGSSLMLPSTAATNIGYYAVVVSNAAGAVTSSSASLTFFDLKMYAGLTISTPVLTNYDIQSSPTLDTASWTTLTNVTPSTQLYRYFDYRYNTLTNAMQFYRLMTNGE